MKGINGGMEGGEGVRYEAWCVHQLTTAAVWNADRSSWKLRSATHEKPQKNCASINMSPLAEKSPIQLFMPVLPSGVSRIWWGRTKQGFHPNSSLLYSYSRLPGPFTSPLFLSSFSLPLPATKRSVIQLALQTLQRILRCSPSPNSIAVLF